MYNKMYKEKKKIPEPHGDLNVVCNNAVLLYQGTLQVCKCLTRAFTSNFTTNPPRHTTHYAHQAGKQYNRSGTNSSSTGTNSNGSGSNALAVSTHRHPCRRILLQSCKDGRTESSGCRSGGDEDGDVRIYTPPTPHTKKDLFSPPRLRIYCRSKKMFFFLPFFSSFLMIYCCECISQVIFQLLFRKVRVSMRT